MLILPAAIVALLFSFIVGPLTISQRFQTQGKLLGYHVQQTLSSLRVAFELQYSSVVFEATTAETVPIHLIETSTTYRVEATSFPVTQNYVEVIIPEVTPIQFNERPSTRPARPFVVDPQRQDPFHWRDLLNHRVFEVLAAIFVSIWFQSVVLPFTIKLLSHSESLDEVEPPPDHPQNLLPPKYLSPPKTIQIRILAKNSRAPLEPIFSPAPQEVPPFWLASKEKQQDRPSSPSHPPLRLLDFPFLEAEPQKQLSPLSSSPDSGYGTILLSGRSVSDESAATTPEHLDDPLHKSDAEPTPANSLNNSTSPSDNPTGENNHVAGFDAELDDDDGSTTITNSTANLADLIPRPAPVSAEDLAAKLESVATALIEEDKPLPETTANLPSNDESTTDLETADKDLVVEEILVDVISPCEHCSDTTDATLDPALVYDQVTVGTDMEGAIEKETAIESDLPSQDNSEGVEPRTPNDDIPNIVVIPPSEVDPEDFALELEGLAGSHSEDGHEESKYEYDSEHEGDHLDHQVVEVFPPAPTSPVRDDPCRTPITTSGLLWADLEGDGLGPLPTFQTEGEGPLSDEVISDTTVETHQSPKIEERPDLHSSPHVSKPSPICTNVQVNTEDRGEGSSRSGRISLPCNLKYFHCCNLYKSGGRPETWENWKLGKACTPKRSSLQEPQFIFPTDKDGENPTTRIAIDNFDATWFQKAKGAFSYKYLTEALESFAARHSECWRGRMIGGIEYASVGYATVDFDSVDEAVRVFKELQGRRLRGHTWHWRLEFVDPEDETHGGRKVVHKDLVPDSVKQALAAELEASTKRRGTFNRSDDTDAGSVAVTRPPVRARPQLSIPGRSLFAGAVATVVQDRRSVERPTQSSARVPPRRPFRP